MADIVSRAQRSKIMSKIRARDTQLELSIRRGLHARGYRYRLHDKKLAGTPDMVFPKFKSVVFVNGCFWHGHDCELFRLPSTRRDFWAKKIDSTRNRDFRAREHLISSGWRVLAVWECSIRGSNRKPIQSIVDQVANWLMQKCNLRSAEISGQCLAVQPAIDPDTDA